MKELKILFSLLIGVALITATSCDKDEDKDEDPPAENKCYIKKELNDDGSYSTFEFNSAHKMILAKEFDDNGSSDGITELTYEGGILKKMEIIDQGVVEEKYEYSYKDGRKDTAWVYENESGTLKKTGFYLYTFVDENPTKIATYTDPGGIGTYIEFEYNEYTYSDNNVTTEKVYAFDLTSMQMELVYTYEYEYDTKKNPYRYIGINNILTDLLFLSNANVTKVTCKDDKGVTVDDESANYVYEYNSNNYPTKITETAFDSSYTDVSMLEYDCE